MKHKTKYSKIIILMMFCIAIGAFALSACAQKNFTLTFVTNSADECAPMVVKKGTTVDLPSDLSKDLFDFAGWFIDPECTQPFSVMPAQDTTIYAGWTAHRNVAIMFDSRGGSYVEQLSGEPNDPVSAPASPTRENYSFVGWKTESGTSYTFSVLPNESITLYAEWTPQAGKAELNVVVSGSEFASLVVSIGSAIPTQQIFGEGYVVSYYSDAAMTTAASPTINASVTIYAKYYTDGLVINAGKVTGYNGSNDDIIIPDTVTEISASAFYKNKGIVSLTVPPSVVTIGDYAFDGCTSLASVTLSEGLTTIGSCAFASTSIATVQIPSTVTTIQGYAFSYNTLLRLVTVGSEQSQSALATVGNAAFAHCPSLFHFMMYKTSAFFQLPLATADDVFRGAPTGFAVYVPESAVSTLKNTIGWGNTAVYAI